MVNARESEKSDVNCSRCALTGWRRAAVVFVGLADPDAKQYPMCREHADEWRLEVMMMIPGARQAGKNAAMRMREDDHHNDAPQ